MFARRLLASALTLSACVPVICTSIPLHWPDNGLPLVVSLLLTGGVVVAAVALHVPCFPLVVFGRALLWCYLVWIALMSGLEYGSVQFDIAWWGVATGLALLVLQRDRLDGPSGSFAPKAFHGTLVAVVTLAIADTCALAFWSIIAAYETDTAAAVALGAAATVMAIAVMGLLRLRTWAYLLNLGANAVIALGAWWVPGLPKEIALCLTITALGQLMTGAPVLWAAARGGARPDAPGAYNRNHLASSLLVAALVVLILSDTTFSASGGCLH